MKFSDGALAISRRSVLSASGAIGAAALLPGLASCGAGSAARRRLVLIYTPYGGGNELWPSAGASVTDSVVLEPLAPHRQRLTLIAGLDGTSPRFAGSWMSAMTAFTGRDPFGDGASVAPGDIDGPSLDSAVAETDGGGVLRIATGRTTTLELHGVSFAPDGRPYDLTHVAAPREACDEQQTSQAMDEIVAALQEDAAHVAVWRMATAADADVAGTAVRGALASGDAAAARTALIAVRRFFAAQVGALVDRLEAAGGSGRETLVVWTSGPCPQAPSAPVPMVVIGNGVPHGHLRVPAESRHRYGDLLHSLGRAAVGPELNTFGDPRFARGPLLEELA
jgi:hypothetical protein